MNRPVVLTIAGSDSGGGAGIQADLRAITSNGGFATTVITALTAQNLDGVRDVHGIPPEHVAEQIAAVTDGFSVQAVKTGMLWSASTIEAVAAVLSRSTVPLVVDPVMVATSGARLLQAEAVECYERLLFPMATLLTPNLDELALLLGCEAIDKDSQLEAAWALSRRFEVSVLAKGGHLEGNRIVDLLVDPETGDEVRFEGKRQGLNTHGSGCALASAIATWLAKGYSTAQATEKGLDFIRDAAAHPLHLNNGVRLLGLERSLEYTLER